MSYKIYAHINKINGKIYIGQTCRKNVNQRWRNGKGYINNIAFYRAIKKYGWDNFEHKILFDGLSKEEADAKETELIALYDSKNPEHGYNLTDGGQGTNGYQMPEERKRQISESQKGRLLTDEWKQHISEAVRGENHPFWGKQLSDKHRRHLSEAHMGNKSYGGMQGKKHTEETKRRMSESHKGHKLSDETIRKMKENSGKIIRCVETGIVYDSIGDACRKTGYKSKTGISRCCKGLQETYNGLHWEYVE